MASLGAGSTSVDRGIAGHLAYVTHTARGDHVDIAAIEVNGNAVRRVAIGPVGSPPAGGSFAIQDLQSSRDQRFLAWRQVPLRRDGSLATARPTLVLHQIRPATNWTLQTRAVPIGFSDAHRFVVNDAGQASTLRTKPTVSLVPIPGSDGVVAGYSEGVIEINHVAATATSPAAVTVSLLTSAGVGTPVHTYVDAGPDSQVPYAALPIGDGRQILIECRDRSGSSSVIDRYRLYGSGSPVRHPLHHFGAVGAGWRIHALTATEQDGKPWAVFDRSAGPGRDSVVAAYERGKWRRIVSSGIAIAGNYKGFVVAQPRPPASDALLLTASSSRVLGVGSKQVAWVNAPNGVPGFATGTHRTAGTPAVATHRARRSDHPASP